MYSDKKGLAIPTGVVMFLAILGVIFGTMWAIDNFGGSKQTTLAAQSSQVTGGGNNILTIPAEDVTVTFSSWDAYAKGTNAGTGHMILSFNGDIGVQVNDDATKQYAPGDAYVALLGNKTTSLTAGTDYYPVLKQGALGNKGTETIGAGQYKTGGASQLTFTVYDENDQPNTNQALAANGQALLKWQIKADDNLCVGNPDTGGENAMSYTYNNTVISSVEQQSGAKIGTPTSVTSRTQHSTITYTFPIVCDNNKVTEDVLVKTTAEVTSKHNVNMTVSDITWDYNADTLEPMSGYADEDNNDIGIADFVVGSLRLS